MISLFPGLIALLVAGCQQPERTKPADHTGIGGETAIEDDTGSDERSLHLSPGAFTVDVGARWPMRAVLEAADGSRVDVTVDWTSSDPAVVHVTAGECQAQIAGEVVISAQYEGLEAQAHVQVQESGELRVQVIDAATGAPVPNARLLDPDEQQVVDSEGRGVLQVGDEPVWITAYGPMGSNYIQATLTHVVSRDIVVPLREKSAEEGPTARVQGTVDFDEALATSTGEKGPGELRAGIAAPSLQEGPLLLNPDTLFGSLRTVSAAGVEIVVPENVYDDLWAPDWSSAVHEGPVGVWTLVGILPLSALVSALDQEQDAFSFLLPYLDGFVHGWRGGLAAVEGTALEVELAPAAFMSERIRVTIPLHPAGFAQDELVQLVALAGTGPEGPAVIGLGQGVQEVVMGRVPLETYGFEGSGGVVGYLELGGPGSGVARILTHGAVEGDTVELAPWQRPPALQSFVGESRAYALETDENVTLVRVHIRSRDGRSRDLYLPSGTREGVLDNQGQPMGYGITTWKLLSVGTSKGTYQSLLADGGLADDPMESLVRTVGMVSREFRD